MKTRSRVNLQSAEKALSHVGGLAVGLLIGLLLTPANILDAIVDTIRYWIQYEITTYQCYRHKVSLSKAIFELRKHNAKNGEKLTGFELAKLRCNESTETRSTFKTTLIYLATRPFVWILLRPFQLALSVAIMGIRVLALPFMHAYIGAKAGFKGSFVAVPNDWFTRSATVNLIKMMAKKSENPSRSEQTRTGELGQHSTVVSSASSEGDSFIQGQISRERESAKPDLIAGVISEIPALEIEEELFDSTNSTSSTNTDFQPTLNG